VDGNVDARDVLEFLCQWRGIETGCERIADFNCDEKIDCLDLLTLQGEWR
jgi:hypothetical protein